MKYSISTAVAASFLLGPESVIAAPFTQADLFEVTTLGGTTYRVKQFQNKGYSEGRRGPIDLMRAYNKFGATVPDDLQSLIDEILEELSRAKNGGGSGKGNGGGNGGGSNKPGNGTMGASPAGNQTNPNSDPNDGKSEVVAVPEMFDIQYLCSVQVGTPPQTLTMNFDTGSSDLWVFSSETSTNQVAGQTLYQPGQSTTARTLNGNSWSISYGDGSSSSGSVFLDTVAIGDVVVANQAVESARNVSAQFTRTTNSDGLVGLAFSKLNTVRPSQQKTFWENAMPDLASPLFTANLKKGEAGNYNFGFIDKTEYTGDITFVPVNTTSGHWEFDLEGYAVGPSSQQTMFITAPHKAIADTGTTLLLAPSDIAAAYWAKVPGAKLDPTAGGYTFPCSATLPDYTAVINNYRAIVPGSFINYAPVDANTFEAATVCFGGIQVTPGGFPFAIYGDIFLKSQFVVFHGGNAQLGFAAKPL